MANKDDNKSAFAAAAFMASRQNNALENVRTQYANDKHHDFNTVKEDALARRQEFRSQREHDAQLALEQSITLLTKEAKALEKAGKLDKAKEKQAEISQVRRQGNEGDAFDMDEVTKNFANTLDEVIEDFGSATREEMKVSVNRMAALMDSIEASNAVEKDFLLEQYKQTQDAMQKEYNKRANIAARATEKLSELGEQYLDISSLYAGFVDHNPVMMGLFRLGADFIKRSRTTKKAQREALIRDKKNQAHADKLNAENDIRAQIDKDRDDAINAQRQETLKIEREAAEAKKAKAKETEPVESSNSQPKPATPEDPKPDVETVDGFDASGFFDGIQSDDDEPAPVMQREQSSNSQAFEFPQDKFAGTGDEPLTQDFMASLFGETDEDGDPTGFTIDRGEEEPVVLDDSTPIQVQQAEETPEQKAQAMFVRQDAEETKRINDEYRAEQIQRDEKTFNKLVDIEEAIAAGNKLTEKNGKAMENIDGGGGLLEALGLGKIASMFKGPILKALMLFGPAVTAIGALLSKIGLGGIAGKLTGGFDGLTEKMGGDRNARQDRANQKAKNKAGKTKPGRGGKFSRLANGAKGVAGKAGNFARAGGGMLARGGGMLARGAMGLLGTTAGAVTAAGAAGYGVGTLINDHVLSDDTKRGIGDFIGPKIDSVLSFFGNDDAQRRLDMMEKMEQQNGQTLGTASPKVGTTEPKLGLEKAPDDLSVMEKQSSGNQLIVQADNIQSNKVVNTKGAESIEVPVQKQTEEKLQMLEEKVIQLADAKAQADNTTVVTPAPPKPSKQKMVQSQPSNTPLQTGRSARNDDSSIQRLTDRFVGMGMA